MALPNGQIRMSQVNTELGSPSSSQISLNDSDVRSLAGKPSGQISMQDLQGASNWSASGGQVADYNGKRYHFFISTGSFTYSGNKTVNYIGIGGGGGASHLSGGRAGGGAGGYAAGSTTINGPGSLTVTVGSGGSYGPTTGNGGNGSASKIGPSIKFGGGGGGGYAAGQTDPLGLGGGGGGGIGNMTPSVSPNSVPSASNAGGTGGSQAGNGAASDYVTTTAVYPFGSSTTTYAYAGGGGGAYDSGSSPFSPSSDSNGRPVSSPTSPTAAYYENGWGGRGVIIPSNVVKVAHDNSGTLQNQGPTYGVTSIFAPGAPQSYPVLAPSPIAPSPSPGVGPQGTTINKLGYGGNADHGQRTDRVQSNSIQGGYGGAGKGGDSGSDEPSDWPIIQTLPYFPYVNKRAGNSGFVCIYYPV